MLYKFLLLHVEDIRCALKVQNDSLTVSLEKTQKNEIELSWLLRLRIRSPIPSISAKNVFYLIREILSFDYSRFLSLGTIKSVTKTLSTQLIHCPSISRLVNPTVE